MIGIQNPKNISLINSFNLISGQPVVSVIESDILVGFYLINNEGSLYQTKGEIDFLFEMKELYDLTSINVKKFNAIKHYLCNTFYCISLKEFSTHKSSLENLENKIFYNFLHAEIEISKLKILIRREINRSDLSINLKRRLIDSLRKAKNPSKKILRKKVDINLSDYGIYINTLVS